MKNKIFKKSQTEILGLAIVVILILVATVFVVRFLVFTKPADHRKSFVTAELASNMLNTFLKTSAQECSQLSMTEVIQDCAQTSGTSCANGQNSCEFLNSVALGIFTKTLKKWHINYEFLIYVNTNRNNPLANLGNPCTGEKKSKLFYAPSNVGTINVQLDLC